jgi:hypothetical protein
MHKVTTLQQVLLRKVNDLLTIIPPPPQQPVQYISLPTSAPQPTYSPFPMVKPAILQGRKYNVNPITGQLQF